jgi:uncharacterized RDD family membrane protein YckC
VPGFKRVSPDPRRDGVFGARIAAFCVDVALVTLASVVVAVALAVEQAAVGPAAAVWLVVWVAYVVGSQAHRGQTLGKYVAGVVVVSADGGPIGLRAAFLRELVRVADLLTCNAVGWVVRVDSRRQRLGDVVADTVVVPAAREERRL